MKTTKKPNLSIPVALSALLLQSCASMFSGTRSDVTFTSIPPGAEVEVDGQVGRTPVTLEVSKKVDEAVFRLPGQEPRAIAIESSLGGGWFLMDLLFTPGFGLVGFLVDGSSGAWNNLPSEVRCDFNEPLGPDAVMASISAD